MSNYSSNDVANAIAAAAKALDARKDEINRLNVFPVPDGDTGTNMSLTLAMVVENLAALPIGASNADKRRAITTGALMGARGNSGVITSQILRGLCEGFDGHEDFDIDAIGDAFAKAVEVAFNAVRKPVEGTILTVLARYGGSGPAPAKKNRPSLEEYLQNIVNAAYASVQRTPDLLPVLKENGVVDAVAMALRSSSTRLLLLLRAAPKRSSTRWRSRVRLLQRQRSSRSTTGKDSNYTYCNEFLVHTDDLDQDAALDFLQTMGDCELCVGNAPVYKVHVHSNTPNKVLEYFLDRGAVSEVHIHNMKLQSAARSASLEEDQAQERKPIGLVAVCAGSGNAAILESLGVDVVVSGGQTMNPSTKELLDAVNRVNADAVIILPNNKNIIMASQSCADVSEKPCAVVPTTSVPEAFSALFVFDENASLEDNVEEMTEVAGEVKTGEVTCAIKDAKDAHGNPIKEGDTIGIADGSIEVVSDSVVDATLGILAAMEAEDADTLTILAGEDLSQEAFDSIVERIEEAYEDIEIDPHRGEQPLYPIILSLE